MLLMMIRQLYIAAESSFIIRLDWLKWVTEVLGASAIGAKFTLHRTQLDEYGNEIGPVEVFTNATITGEDRIITWFRAEDKQYFVVVRPSMTPLLLQTNGTG